MITHQEIRSIVNAHLLQPLDALDPATPIREAIADSFAYVELALELEQACGVSFADGQISELETVADLTAAIDARLATLA